MLAVAVLALGCGAAAARSDASHVGTTLDGGAGGAGRVDSGSADANAPYAAEVAPGVEDDGGSGGDAAADASGGGDATSISDPNGEADGSVEVDADANATDEAGTSGPTACVLGASMIGSCVLR